MATLTRFDDLFFGILQTCEQIEPFLDIVFSFLARRTDFFRIMHNKTDKMGFPPGVAEKMLLKIFKKYQSLVLQNETRSNTGNINSKGRANSEKISSDAKSLPTSSISDDPPANTRAPQSTSPSDVSPAVLPTVDVQTSKDGENLLQQTQPNTQDESQASSSTRSSSRETLPAKSQKSRPETSSDCFNGAALENYMWSQTGTDVDVRVPVSSDIKGKDILVEIKDKYLKVALKNMPGAKSLIDGELQWKIHADESMWTLVPGEHIHISLEKVEERWWTCVIKGDQEIDKSKIDTTRDISEFDEQTQTDYQRVMFDHQQKMLGKPTSQEMKTHELLKKAWDAPNSPFAGTPFDPSQVNISGGFS